MVYSEEEFWEGLRQHCSHSLRSQAPGANACTLASSAQCVGTLCEAEIQLCQANTLLEIRGLHAELRLRLPPPRSSAGPEAGVVDAGAADAGVALTTYSVPQQTVGTNAVLAWFAQYNASNAASHADVGLSWLETAQCTLQSSQLLYGPVGQEMTVRAGLAHVLVEAYHVFSDATDAASSDFLAVAEASSEQWPLITVPHELDEAFFRAMSATSFVGPLLAPLSTSPEELSFCAGEPPAGAASVALDLFRQAGLNPSLVQASGGDTEYVALGNFPGSLRNRLAAVWHRPQLSTTWPDETDPDPLTGQQVLDVWGVTLGDLDVARQYLQHELRVFHRDTSITAADDDAWFAAVGNAPTPLPFSFHSMAARRAISPAGEATIAPRGISGIGVLNWGWAGIVDQLAKLIPYRLRYLPAQALADPEVARPLSVLLAELEDVYFGQLELRAATTLDQTQATLYLPTELIELDDLLLVSGESALACLTRGDVESVRCTWPDDDVVSPEEQVRDTEATIASLPVRVVFPTVPASDWQTVYLVRLRAGGIPNVPGQYEPLFGRAAPAAWVSLEQRVNSPIVPEAERRLGDLFSPNSRSCDRAQVTCTGIATDEMIALEDDLSADGDPRESSWRHYLELARSAANEADLLGEAVLEDGLSIDQRAELATQALREICGANVDIDPLAEIDVSELRSPTACPDGTGCPEGYVCEDRTCVRDLVDLVGRRPEPEFQRLAACLAPSEVVDLVAVGDHPVCVWHEIGNPNAVCAGPRGPLGCPFEPIPAPPGTTGTLAQRCPVPDPALYTPLLIEGDNLLGFAAPDAEESTRAGGVPPCAAIRAFRSSAAGAERTRALYEILFSGFFKAPNALQAIGASVSWRAQPRDFSTLSVGGEPRMTTGDFVEGVPEPEMWPCAPHTTEPAGCEGAGHGLFCDTVECADGQQRASYNDRLARAAILARLLTGNDMSGFRLPSYPRFDADQGTQYAFGGRVTHVLESRGALLRTSPSIGDGQFYFGTGGDDPYEISFAVPFVPAAFDGLDYRVYAYCNGGSASPLWRSRVGGVLVPMGDRVDCRDPVAFYDVPSTPTERSAQPQVAEFWRDSLARALVGALDAPESILVLPTTLAPPVTASCLTGSDRGNRSECEYCVTAPSLTEDEVDTCFRLSRYVENTLDDHSQNPTYLEDEKLLARHRWMALGPAGNGAWIAREGFTGNDFLDAVELLCEAGSSRAAGCDFDHPPAIREAADLPVAGAFVGCIAREMERTAALTVMARMPRRAVDALREQSSVGSFPAVGGRYGEELSRLRGALAELASVPGLIASEVAQMGFDIETAQEELARARLTQESAEVEFLSSLSDQVTRCGTAYAGALTSDPTAAAGGAIAAQLVCANAFSQIQYAGRIQEITEESAEGSARSTIVDLRRAFSLRSEALRGLASRLSVALENIDAALASLESLRQSGRAALANALFLSGDGARRAYYVNSFMRVRYDARRIRYERARERAMRLAFLARRAIEQRLGADLGTMHDDLGIVSAPADWVGDLCTLDGIDYRRLRDTTDLPRGTLDASISLSNGFIGDYVDRLELVFTAYANRYPFRPGASTTVFSLRDHVQNVRAVCEPDEPGVNLLYRTDELASEAPSGSGGWEAVGCNDAGGACVAVTRLDDDAADGGVVGFGRPPAFRVAFGPYGGQVCDEAGQCAAACTASSCVCSQPGCDTTAATEWRQLVTLEPGRYRISWYGRPVGAPSEVDAEAALDRTRSLSGAVAFGPVSSRALPSGWRRFWRLLEVAGVSPASVVVSIASRNVDGGHEAIGAVDVAGLMLEDVSHAIDFDISSRSAPPPEPSPYVGTRGDTLASTLRACEDTDGRVFRAEGWRRGCERLCADGFARGCSADDTAEHCYWETQFTLSQQLIEQSDVFRNGSFAVGNFNYRMDSLAINFVGTGLRDCSRSDTPTACYGTGVIPFSLTHVGPYEVRNHWGHTYEAPLFAARVEHGQGLAAERYLSIPLSSADRALIDSVTHHEFRGRPLDGTYVLRIWEAEGIDFERLEDVQIKLDYYYWTRGL
ncbi:hypothetical protein [Sandaracinus amylolyticus]|uniref:hypothetical protein n=1 Tax=Sandaracinus amylolyticus TaxID=927083 RepID=UPI001F385292|nr:hypothetical protein [Sandaracinus amylolyticus]UJR78624.1 Hypothetical protein I5071_6550 [Sandaracinus amylolyticus]